MPRLWHTNAGDLMRTLEDHGLVVFQVAFDSNNLLASGSGDMSVCSLIPLLSDYR